MQCWYFSVCLIPGRNPYKCDCNVISILSIKVFLNTLIEFNRSQCFCFMLRVALLSHCLFKTWALAQRLKKTAKKSIFTPDCKCSWSIQGAIRGYISHQSCFEGTENHNLCFVSSLFAIPYAGICTFAYEIMIKLALNAFILLFEVKKNVLQDESMILPSLELKLNFKTIIFNLWFFYAFSHNFFLSG